LGQGKFIFTLFFYVFANQGIENSRPPDVGRAGKVENEGENGTHDADWADLRRLVLTI
jgi:hypothetical protein